MRLSAFLQRSSRATLQGLAVPVGVLALLAGVVVFAAPARSPANTVRLGVLSPFFLGEAYLQAFRDGLHEYGYAEGQNLTVADRFAEGQAERLPPLANELAHLEVAVILAVAPVAALAAKQATSTIPIVFRTTDYVDHSLKGANPGDLRVERPSRFELIINLGTARALGLTIPSALLVEATDVIP